MSPSREGNEDKLGSEDFSWQVDVPPGKRNGKSPRGVIRGPFDVTASHRGLRLKSGRQGQRRGRQRNVTVMTRSSYLNVHPPADLPPPPTHFHLLASGSEEITISVLMTRMKVLELITGHNTSFSALIRKLIGNRLVCFSRYNFSLRTEGLIRRTEQAIFISRQGWRKLVT